MQRKIIAFILVIVMISCLMSLPVSAEETEPEMTFVGQALSLQDSIYIKYYVNCVNAENVKLLVWTEPQTEYVYGTQTAELSSGGTKTVSGKLCNEYSFTGIVARRMADDVYARAYTVKNGQEYYSAIKKYSILTYAYNKLGKTGTASTDAKLISLLKELLEYGAAAQVYKNYNTDRLATQDYYQVKLTNGNLADQCNTGLYLVGDAVSVYAAATNAEGKAFSHWENSAGTTVATTNPATITVGAKNEVYTAVYGAAVAEECSEGLVFESNGDGTCYVSDIGECTDTEVKIPSSYNGETVTAIGAAAFATSDITAIHIPVTVTEVESKAFNKCTELTDVYYGGTEEQWNQITIGTYNTALNVVTIHYAGETPEVTKYTVTFKDYDGTVLKAEDVESGADATPPADPTRAGYTFTGWEGSYTNVTAPVTVTAKYEVDNTRKFTVNFVDYDGTVLAAEQVAEGKSAPLPADPTRSGYIFAGWDGEFQYIDGETEIEATYIDATSDNVFQLTSAKETNGNYTVTFKVTGSVNVAAWNIELSYDSNLIEYVSSRTYSGTIVNHDRAGHMIMNWSSVENINAETKFVTITFKAKTGVTDGNAQVNVSAVNSVGAFESNGSINKNIPYNCIGTYVSIG